MPRPKASPASSTSSAAKSSNGSRAGDQKNKPKVRIAPNGYRLADPIPLGEVLTDIMKQRWILGPAIATGGFGDIYVARKIGENERAVKTPRTSIEKLSSEWTSVIKVDRDTGPLFAEINFYLRSAKESMIEEWKLSRGLFHLGMPHYVSSGRHAPGYRFLVLQRFKTDLEQYLKTNPLTVRDTLSIAIQIIDIIEYIHSRGYIHCDIKASNLLLALDSDQQSSNGDSHHHPAKKSSKKSHTNTHSNAKNNICIYLVDFGNVEKFIIDGSHRSYEEDLRRAHNGTLEFCSRDAHVGALSRRTDFECLGYNLLYWLTETLPWKQEKNHEAVFESKKDYMDHVTRLVEYCLSHAGQPHSSNPNNGTLPNGNGLEEGQPPIKIKRGPGRPPKIKPLTPPTVPTTPTKSSLALFSASGKFHKILVDFFRKVAKLDFNQTPDYEAFKDTLNPSLMDSRDLDHVLVRSSSIANGDGAVAVAAAPVNGHGNAANGHVPPIKRKTPSPSKPLGVKEKGKEKTHKRKEPKTSANGNGIVNDHHHHQNHMNAKPTPQPTVSKVSALMKRVQVLNPTPAMLEVMRKMEAAKNGF